MGSIDGMARAVAQRPLKFAIVGQGNTPIEGGKLVAETLTRRGHAVDWIPAAQLANAPADDIARGVSLLGRPDAVLLRTGANTPATALAGLKVLARDGVPVFPRPEAIGLVGSKASLATLLQKHGIPHPPTVVLNRVELVRDESGTLLVGGSSADQAEIRQAIRTLGPGSPMVVKPASDMGGRGVLFYDAASEQSIGAGAETLFDLGGYDQLVAQQWIVESGGRDTRAYFVRHPDGSVAVAPHALERVGGEGRAKANISGGGTFQRAPMTDEQREITQRFADIARLDIGSVDFLHSSSGHKVIEANSAPGLDPEIVQVIGTPMHEAIADLLVAGGRASSASS